MHSYQRLFGIGPLGFAISVALLAITVLIDGRLGLAGLGIPLLTRTAVLAVATALTLAVAIWGFLSLPPRRRGRELVTTGAFRWFRHPLYASFLTFFDFGLAIFLNHWIYVVWAISLHPIWHFLIASEERVMHRAFPDRYRAYCAVTGRFIPRLFAKRFSQ